MASNRHGEVDFVLEKDGEVLPIEVKSGKHYKRHRALGRLLAEPEYKIRRSIVYNDDAFKVEGPIRYEPIYMCMFLERDPLPEKLIYDIGTPV